MVGQHHGTGVRMWFISLLHKVCASQFVAFPIIAKPRGDDCHTSCILRKIPSTRKSHLHFPVQCILVNSNRSNEGLHYSFSLECYFTECKLEYAVPQSIYSKILKFKAIEVNLIYYYRFKEWAHERQLCSLLVSCINWKLPMTILLSKKMTRSQAPKFTFSRLIFEKHT